MKQELQEILYSKFPKIFADKDKSMRETCMCWGICCDNGWYGLIYDLCNDIQNICDKYKCQVIADKVKEKFGSLQFYYHIENLYLPWYIRLANKVLSIQSYWKFRNLFKLPDYRIEELVDKAEYESFKICEICGININVDKRIKGTWEKTLCIDCCIREGYDV